MGSACLASRLYVIKVCNTAEKRNLPELEKKIGEEEKNKVLIGSVKSGIEGTQKQQDNSQQQWCLQLMFKYLMYTSAMYIA